ncbi:MAG: TatD family hydrolase [Lentimonas sp.]
MPCPLYDAHCHLADKRLLAHVDNVEASLANVDCRYSVVNGTCPADWSAVLHYSRTHPRALPAIGLHPWQVNDAPEDWQNAFLQALDCGVGIVGEIGLDQWIESHDIDAQQAAFTWQLSEATKRQLPVSIHCLKAIGPLMKTLRAVELPARGIHLHALNVPVATAHELIEMGAYFSFNAGQLKPNAKHIVDLIRSIPDDRILIETDAPDFFPRETHRAYKLPYAELNHPANLAGGYQAIAEIRQLSDESLRKQVEKNFLRYFLYQS